MSDLNERRHMLECEARYWLRRGNTTPEKVAELKGTHLNKCDEKAGVTILGGGHVPPAVN